MELRSLMLVVVVSKGNRSTLTSKVDSIELPKSFSGLNIRQLSICGLWVVSWFNFILEFLFFLDKIRISKCICLWNFLASLLEPFFKEHRGEGNFSLMIFHVKYLLPKIKKSWKNAWIGKTYWVKIVTEVSWNW